TVNFFSNTKPTRNYFLTKVHKNIIIFYPECNMMIGTCCVETTLALWFLYNINDIGRADSISNEAVLVSFLGQKFVAKNICQDGRCLFSISHCQNNVVKSFCSNFFLYFFCCPRFPVVLCIGSNKIQQQTIRIFKWKITFSESFVNRLMFYF